MKKLRLLLLSLFLWSNGLHAQGLVTISGTVSDSERNEPLIGATVVASNGTGVSTLMDGTYSIKVPAGTRLIFQYVGYESVEFICPDDQTSVVHNVKLTSQTQAMDDVVVVAYGVRKKGTVAGSVATVKSDAVKDVPAASFDQALQGQATGLTVLSNTGEPGAPATFQIRGVNSINSGTEPLFILDGIPISSSSFNAISPSDIESISVLKDAASTSIYGARAANGVVVITTKRGRLAQDAQVTFRTQLGFSQLAHGKWNLMNTQERIQYEKEVGLTAGKDYDELSKINIDWLDEVYRSHAFLQNYELQVNGATDRVNYYVSGSFFDQDGVSTDSDFRRYSLRTNISFKANDWLRFGTNTMLAFEEYAQSNYGDYALYAPISAAHFMLPYWNPYKKDGSLASSSDGSWKGIGVNPLEWAEANPYKNEKYKVISTIFAEITPFEGFTFRTNGGIDYTHGTINTSSLPSFPSNNNSGSAGRSSSEVINLTISNTANYVFDIDGIHRFNFLAGQEGVYYHSKGFSVTTSGQSNDKLSNLASGTIARSWSNSDTEYTYLSFFGRGEYNYDSRYFGEFSIRTDGSSRFGSEGRWAAFWSLGFMWNMRNEKFLSNADWLSELQFSVSTGTSGNSSIPNYDHLALVAGGIEYNGQAAIAPYSMGNEKLKWEKLWITNVGIRAGFWNRANLGVEYYYKENSNMLMSVPTSYSNTGFGFRWDNIGTMINRGVEISASGDVIRNRNFTWNLYANVSYNYSEITELYNNQNEYTLGTSATKLVKGRSYGEFYLNRFAGVNAATGDPIWLDINGNYTSEFRDSDKVMTGKSYIAPWQGGFGTSFTWKGVSVAAHFSWVKDRWMINNDRYFEENSLLDVYNQSKRMLYDRWKKPGDITDIPRHGTTPQFDTHLLEDASFLRLKNLTVSYTLPQSLLNKTGFLKSVRVYAQGQNLFTWTGFSGLDPESSSNIYKAQYPMTRQFTFGAEVTF